MDRPPEHLISAQQQALDAERAQRPLVGRREAIEALVREYAEASEAFRGKVAYLARTYSSIQYIRGDGSCFVRGACVFGLLNWLRTAPSGARARVVAMLQGACARAVAVGYSEIVVEDFFDVMLEEAQRCCAAESCTEDELIARLQDKETSDYCVMAMRFFIATVMLENEDTFVSFVPDASSMREYVRQEIEPLNRESEETSLMAFALGTGVPFAVEYLDQSGSPTATNSHIFRAPGSSESDPVAFTLLFRPGHFDILVK